MNCRKIMRVFGLGVVLFLCVTAVVGCTKKRHGATAKPNQDIQYEKGADLRGVIKSIDKKSSVIAFYNPVFDTEKAFLYDSATEIISKNDVQETVEEISPGEVFDLYMDAKGGLAKMKETADIVVEEDAEIKVDADTHIITVDDINYSYSDFMVSLSGGKEINPMEITELDQVTFRGVEGKAYSLIVTKGHGYIQPEKYEDFVGGTLTIDGEAILPVSEGMLIAVPEGKQKISMKNGFLESKADTSVKRDELTVVDMSQFMTQKPHTSSVTFHIYPEGAELYINGAYVDYSKPINMYYGAHAVKVVLEGYNAYTGTITVKDPEASVRIDLAEETATVEDDGDSGDSGKSSSTTVDDTTSDPSVTTPVAEFDTKHKITVSAPDGVSVYVNGAYQGKAPYSFAKTLGSITLTLQREGYKTKSYSLDVVDDNEDVTLSFPDLTVDK